MRSNRCYSSNCFLFRRIARLKNKIKVNKLIRATMGGFAGGVVAGTICGHIKAGKIAKVVDAIVGSFKKKV